MSTDEHSQEPEMQVMVWYNEEDWETCKSLFDDAHLLPKHYQEWLDRAQKIPTVTCRLTVPYHLLAAVRKIIEREQIEITAEDFQQHVELTTKVPAVKETVFINIIADIGNGTIPLVKI